MVRPHNFSERESQYGKLLRTERLRTDSNGSGQGYTALERNVRKLGKVAEEDGYAEEDAAWAKMWAGGGCSLNEEDATREDKDGSAMMAGGFPSKSSPHSRDPAKKIDARGATPRPIERDTRLTNFSQPAHVNKSLTSAEISAI